MTVTCVTQVAAAFVILVSAGRNRQNRSVYSLVLTRAQRAFRARQREPCLQ
jgi:hypothetical protein